MPQVLKRPQAEIGLDEIWWYLPIEDGIEVVRVLRGMRDIDTLF